MRTGDDLLLREGFILSYVLHKDRLVNLRIVLLTFFFGSARGKGARVLEARGGRSVGKSMLARRVLASVRSAIPRHAFDAPAELFRVQLRDDRWDLRKMEY